MAITAQDLRVAAFGDALSNRTLEAVIDAPASQRDDVRAALTELTSQDYDWAADHPAGTPEYDAAFIRSELRAWAWGTAMEEINATAEKAGF